MIRTGCLKLRSCSSFASSLAAFQLLETGSLAALCGLWLTGPYLKLRSGKPNKTKLVEKRAGHQPSTRCQRGLCGLGKAVREREECIRQKSKAVVGPFEDPNSEPMAGARLVRGVAGDGRRTRTLLAQIPSATSILFAVLRPDSGMEQNCRCEPAGLFSREGQTCWHHIVERERASSSRSSTDPHVWYMRFQHRRINN